MIRSTTSASNLHRRQSCPGSALAEEGAPESSERPDAAKGTALHFYDAMENEDGDSLSDAEFLKRNRDLREAFMAHHRAKLGIPDDERSVICRDNQEYWLKDGRGQRLPVVGHPDLTVFYPRFKTLFAFDTKTGRRPVPMAANNLQLRAYAVLLSDEFDADKIYATIVQPLVSPTIHSAIYERENIPEFRREIIDIYQNTLVADAPRYPSKDACLYCRAAGSCREGLGLIKQLATVKISELSIPAFEAMSEMVELVEDVCKKYWEKYKYIAQHHPELLTKHTLKPGANVEYIEPSDNFKAWQLLGEAGLTQEEFRDATSISLPKVREVIAAKSDLSLKDAKVRTSEILKPILKTSQKAPSLVEKKDTLLLK